MVGRRGEHVWRRGDDAPGKYINRTTRMTGLAGVCVYVCACGGGGGGRGGTRLELGEDGVAAVRVRGVHLAREGGGTGGDGKGGRGGGLKDRLRARGERVDLCGREQGGREGGREGRREGRGGGRGREKGGREGREREGIKKEGTERGREGMRERWSKGEREGGREEAKREGGKEKRRELGRGVGRRIRHLDEEGPGPYGAEAQHHLKPPPPPPPPSDPTVSDRAVCLYDCQSVRMPAHLTRARMRPPHTVGQDAVPMSSLVCQSPSLSPSLS
jgi:hypothetical protein